LSDANLCTARLSEPIRFESPDWSAVPDRPGVYVISDMDEVIYVGMAGRNGRGSLRRRLQDHASGQIVNMFAQYLFLARVQFVSDDRITHPRPAKAACRAYIAERCSFQYLATMTGAEARALENQLKAELQPTLNP
jgi:excinuclease UvrABC nuclease subunit